MSQSKAERIGAYIEEVLRLPIKDKYDEGYHGAFLMMQRALAEPDPPRSDAGAEIVARLRLLAECAQEDYRDLCEGKAGSHLEEKGYAEGLGMALGRAQESVSRHQTRRVVVVELDEDMQRCMDEAASGLHCDVWAPSVGERVHAAYRAQHPQPPEDR